MNRKFSQPSNAFYIASIVASVVAAYWSGIGVFYFADDFKSFFPPLDIDAFSFFMESSPLTRMYRPVADATLALIQSGFGMETWPIQVTQIALHIMLCVLVYLGCLELGTDRIQAMFAGLLMAVSQANVHAVISNDTLSQVGAVAFGYLSAYLLLVWARDDQSRRSTWVYVLALAAFVIAAFSKETGTGMLLVCGAVIVAATLFSHDGRQPRLTTGTAVLAFAPFALITFAYLALRASLDVIQPEFGDELYNLRIGSNILVNIGQMAVAATIPFPSPDLFAAAANQSVIFWSALVATLLLIGMVSYGTWLANWTSRSLVLAGIAAASLGPALLLSRISELYVYTAMPLVSIVFGVGMGGLMRRGSKSGSRLAPILLCGTILVGNVISVHRKIDMMRDNGDTARALLAGVVSYARSAPPGAWIVLLDPTYEQRLRYSVFRIDDFQLLQFSGSTVQFLADRPDVSVAITPRLDMVPPDADVLYLTTCDGGRRVCREHRVR